MTNDNDDNDDKRKNGRMMIMTKWNDWADNDNMKITIKTIEQQWQQWWQNNDVNDDAQMQIMK